MLSMVSQMRHLFFSSALLLLCLSCGSAPERRAPPKGAESDRACRPHLQQTPDGDGRDVERCVFEGNPVTVRAKPLDMHHLQVSIELRESVSGCGELSFNIAALYPSGLKYEQQDTVRCEDVCVDEAGEEPAGCYDAALRSFELVAKFEHPFPGFTLEGQPVNGNIPVTVTSKYGSLGSISTVALVSPE